MRFLGRKIYAGLVVVLVSTMVHGLNAERVRRIRALLKTDQQIDRRTLERWRQWWLDTFVRCSFWKEARARFMPPVCEKTLPNSLCARFEIGQRNRLVALLKFLAPITTPTAWKELAMQGSARSRRACRWASYRRAGRRQTSPRRRPKKHEKRDV